MANTQVLLVHGFNVRDMGQHTIAELSHYFQHSGCIPHVHKYGHFSLTEARFKNDNVAAVVAAFVNNTTDKTILVGHSNGAAIIYLAFKLYGCKPDHTVFINPALERDIVMPPSCRSLDVWHSPSDTPVKLATWLINTKYLPWGAMGAYGPANPDPRVAVFNKEAMTPSSSAHSDVFHTDKISYFGPLITNIAIERMNNLCEHHTKFCSCSLCFFGSLPVKK